MHWWGLSIDITTMNVIIIRNGWNIDELLNFASVNDDLRYHLKKKILLHSGRAAYLYSTAHKTQLTVLQLEDFLHTSLFPDLLPQPLGGFINNIFRG